MKKSKLFILILALFAFGQTAWAKDYQFDGSGTESDPYRIENPWDWMCLCNEVDYWGNTYKGKYFKMTADIYVDVSNDYHLVGNADNSFRGIFDGDGHTLTFNEPIDGYQSGDFEDYRAPFRSIRGATIKNLHVMGNIKGRFYASGLVAKVYGTDNHIINCRSEIRLYLKRPVSSNRNDLNCGGLVGHVDGSSAASLTIENCLFDGKFTSYANYGNGISCWCGFVNEASGNNVQVSVTNSLFAPTEISGCFLQDNNWYVFVRGNGSNVNITNCYYKTTANSTQAQGATDASSYTQNDLCLALGGAWTALGESQVVPVMTNIPFMGSGTSESPYQIGSEAEWYTLAYLISNGYQNFSSKYLKQTADIAVSETVATGKVPIKMLGTSESRSFQGTYDGNGHTLTVNYTDNSDDHYCGPFRFINGATIKNLHVDGTIIKRDKKHAGGFVGKAYGTNNIVNCRSSVYIQSSTDGDGSHGGFLGDLRGGTTNFKNCVFDGKLHGSDTKNWGGFVGWVADGKKANFTNCLFAPTLVNVENDGNRTFARRNDGDDLTFTNCYYTQTLGSAQGKEACSISANEHVTMTPNGTEEIGISGGVTAYSLGSGVYNPCIMANGTLYSGSGNNVQLNLTLNGESVANYESDKFIATPGTLNGTASPFTLVMPNTNTVVSLAPTDWNTHAGTEADPYLIYTAEQWNLLAYRVNGTNGQIQNNYNGKYFKLMADITVSTMVGNSENYSFRGIFDGNGHTLTFNYNDSSSNDRCAPFRYMEGATIKFLHVAGSITKSSGKYAAGIAGRAAGNNTISNCRSSVDIYFTHTGDITSGGFIGEIRGSSSATTTFTNCLFDGKLRGTSTDHWGGFVGWVGDPYATFNNCLFAPAEVPSNANDSENKTFARMNSDSHLTVNYSYYKTVLGNNAQGAINAASYSNAKLLESLGLGWETVMENEVEKVVPIMTVYPLSGDGTENSPYLITSTDDWNHLASNQFMGENYNGKYFQLTNDISVSRMVGFDASHAFQGTFDGDGNTITVSYGSSGSPSDIQYCAPFKNTYGATIKNLITTGTIYTSSTHAGGVVGRNGTGCLTLNNVKSDVEINSTFSGNAQHGGLVGWTIQADIIGCAFTGRLLGENSTGCGGLLGYKTYEEVTSKKVTITDCLFAPDNVTVSATSAYTLANNSSTGVVEISNSYYTQTLGTTQDQGKQRRSISAGSNVTVENAGSAFEYTVSGITTYGIGIKYNDVLYAGNGDAVSLTLGYTLPGYDVTSYNANNGGTIEGSSNPYTLTMPDANVTITATTTAAEWDGDGDSWETAYLIYNKDQFKLLASRVNNGTSTYANKYFKLMTDFTISITGNNSDATTANDMANNLVGVSTTNTFNGHFDGNGYKITLNFTTENTGNHYIAPFRYTNGAEIKNLHIAGKSNCRIYETGGIIGHAQGNNTISGCHVKANFTVASNQSTANQQYPNLENTTRHGTFISYVASGNNVIEGCLFDSSIVVRQGYVTSITWYNDYGAGFVGGSASDATVTVKGCVFNPTSVDNRFRYAKTFVAGDATVNVINSYYINYPLANPQGKRMRSFAPADEHVTITASTPTILSVSGITTYNDCIYWDDAFRAGEADEVNLSLSNDLSYNGYEVNAGSIARNGSNWTLTMPDEDVTISAIDDWAGTGTQNDPYIISRPCHLNLLAQRVNNGVSSYTGEYFQLANDITYDYSTLGATESNYTAIGCMIYNSNYNPENPYVERYFDGNFDGQGHTISGIRIRETGNYRGLFGYNRSNAVVRNVTLSDSEITGSVTVGGIVGWNLGGTITNCHVTNTVVLHGTNSNTMDFGGIVGTNAQSSSVISYCTSSASFTLTEEDGYTSMYFGGIVGANVGTLSHNLVIGTTIPACEFNYQGAIAGGNGDENDLNNNYYVNCTVAGVANATGVGIGSKEPSNFGDPRVTYDVIANDGAVPGNVRTVAGHNGDNNGGWVFIASPVTTEGGIAPSAVSGLFPIADGNPNPNSRDYDLYRFNQSNANGKEWENYKNADHTSDFNLVNGQGYLYARKETGTLVFTGPFNTGETMTVDLDYDNEASLAGYNLVGNPFPRAAYITDRSYYKMSEGGSYISATAASASDYIPPCTGVIVQATEAGQSVTFSTTAPEPEGSNYNNGSLRIALVQANTRSNAVMDNAIVSFDEGSQLGKFYFGEQNANIYLPQGGEDYAIAYSDKQGEMPLNFKANENGTYTLTINPEGVEVGYLHLIDNMTGADVDLLANPSYSFNAKVTDYESRFRLVFAAADEAVCGPSEAFAFISDGNLIVNGTGTLQVIDLTGRVIFTGDAMNRVSTNGMMPGVYVLRLINGDDVKVQKIVLK